jgi:hypothetical protein
MGRAAQPETGANDPKLTPTMKPRTAKRALRGGRFQVGDGSASRLNRLTDSGKMVVTGHLPFNVKYA